MAANPLVVQNFANSCWVVLAVWAGVESTDRHIFFQDMSSRPRGPQSQQLLVGIGIDMFASKNWLSAAKIRKSHFARIASFRPFAVASGPCNHLTAFSH
jgi:hypothetical protein